MHILYTPYIRIYSLIRNVIQDVTDLKKEGVIKEGKTRSPTKVRFRSTSITINRFQGTPHILILCVYHIIYYIYFYETHLLIHYILYIYTIYIVHIYIGECYSKASRYNIRYS